MLVPEDDLPQKQRVPASVRRCIGNDAEARSLVPINGTTLDGQARPLSRKKKLEYYQRKDKDKKRKAQREASHSEVEGGGHTTASGRTGAERKKKPSSGGTRPTIVHPPTTAPRPQAEFLHSWSIHDPPTAAVPVDQHPTTPPAHILPHQPYQAPPVTMNEYTLPVHNPVHFQPPPLRATTVSLSFSPEETCMVGNDFTTHIPATVPDLETGHGSPLVASLTPPTTVWEDNQQVSPTSPSAHGPPEHNLALNLLEQGSEESTDLLNTVYQGFFVHRVIDNREHSPKTAQQGNCGPEPQGYSTASTFVDNTVCRDLVAEQYPCDVPQVEVGTVAWSTTPALVTPTDRKRSEDVERVLNAGYVYSRWHVQSIFPSAVPEEAYTAMHPAPPSLWSSYSELADALKCPPPDAICDDPVLSSKYSSPSTLCPVVSGAEPRGTLDTDPSRGASSIDVGQVSLALPSPEDRPVTDNEYARFIQDCLDVNERLLSELSSSLSLSLSASFATGQACDISQQLQATPTWL